MKNVTHLRIYVLSFNFNTGSNISISVNFTPKYYNAVILNPAINNY
jgi:hypothetical protein